MMKTNFLKLKNEVNRLSLIGKVKYDGFKSDLKNALVEEIARRYAPYKECKIHIQDGAYLSIEYSTPEELKAYMGVVASTLSAAAKGFKYD